jgi:hypothetical protein
MIALSAVLLSFPALSVFLALTALQKGLYIFDE